MTASNNIEIKHATLDNIDELALLFDQYRVFYKQTSDLALAKSFLTERIFNNESVIYIAFVAGKAIAFTQLYPKYSSARAIKNWILNDLFVENQFRNSGIATKLIQHVLLFTKNDNSAFVQLETSVDNLNAQKLYDKMGFEIQTLDTEFLLYRKSL